MISEHQYRLLGRSGLRVSPLGVGTNRWRRGGNDHPVFETFDALVQAGVNFFDTAEVYQAGDSERLLGACLKRTSKVIVASKFRPFPERTSLAQFFRALDGSLARLGLQSLDLYYIHFPPTSVSVETVSDWLAEAVRLGKTRAVGVSNFDAEQMRRASLRLASHGIPLAANQVEYSLFHRHPEIDGVLDTCRELGVALVAYKPLGRGRFLPTASSGAANQLTDLLAAIARKHNKSASQVALNWLLKRGDQVVAIPGTTNAGHGLENLGALGWELSDGDIASLNEATSPPTNRAR